MNNVTAQSANSANDPEISPEIIEDAQLSQQRNLMGFIKNLAKRLFALTIWSASKEYGFFNLAKKLEKVVPDVTDQYTTFKVNDVFLTTMVRCLHAFQTDLVLRACQRIEKNDLTIADIGDSSGNHLKYLQSSEVVGQRNVTALSVNLDPIAVNKIREQGLEAIECRAEELHLHPDFQGRSVDMFMSFETLEHLRDPISFLHELAKNDTCSYFVVTVPFIRHSRLGLHQIRRGDPAEHCAENTHIYELSPADWKLMFKFAGWEVVEDQVYRMFPRRNPLVLMNLAWRKFPFDGYFGCILRRNTEISDRYQSW